MKTAVDEIGRGKARTVNARFRAMTGHFLFEADFCNSLVTQHTNGRWAQEHPNNSLCAGCGGLPMKTHEHKFALGTVVMTRACLEFCAEHEVNAFAVIARHARGDWGDLGDADKQANERALLTGDRLLSAYVEKEQKFYVVTEHDRSVTTLMLASDY